MLSQMLTKILLLFYAVLCLAILLFYAVLCLANLTEANYLKALYWLSAGLIVTSVYLMK